MTIEKQSTSFSHLDHRTKRRITPIVHEMTTPIDSNSLNRVGQHFFF